MSIMRCPSTSISIASALAAAALLFAPSAAADLPPPEGYVETCTAAQKQGAGTECYGCSSYHGSLDKCPNLLSPQGFTKACQTRGASVWTEVWCRPAGGAPLPAEVQKEVKAPTPEELAAAKANPGGAVTPPGRSGCSACAASGTSDAGGLFAALLGVTALLVRRGGSAVRAGGAARRERR